MRFMNLKSILAAIVVTTAALSTHAAKAETPLNVPFSFTVAGQTLPAGEYTAQQDTFHNVVILRNKTASKSFTYALRPGDGVELMEGDQADCGLNDRTRHLPLRSLSVSRSPGQTGAAACSSSACCLRS